jgi:hypothetical protein
VFTANQNLTSGLQYSRTFAHYLAQVPRVVKYLPRINYIDGLIGKRDLFTEGVEQFDRRAVYELADRTSADVAVVRFERVNGSRAGSSERERCNAHTRAEVEYLSANNAAAKQRVDFTELGRLEEPFGSRRHVLIEVRITNQIGVAGVVSKL